MNAKKHTSRKGARILAGCRGLAAVVALVLLAGLVGCETTDQAVTATPSSYALVEMTFSSWVFGQNEETHQNKEAFFAVDSDGVPIYAPLKELYNSCQKYGYDFNQLRQQTWEMVEQVDHVGAWLTLPEEKMI